MAFTKQEINRMTSDEYRQRLSDPEFVKAMNEPAAASASTATATAPVSFDPSFDQIPSVSSTQVAPPAEPIAAVPAVAAVPVVPAELPEFKIAYQPTDESGRPVGGLQVIKYQAEQAIPESHPLIQQLIKNHSAATVSLREARKKNILEGKDVPEGAVVFPTIKPLKVYTPEYRKTLEESLQDPAKVEQASQLLEQDDVRLSQNRLQEDNFNTQALLALEQFKNDNPDYYKCRENADSIVAWFSSR